MRRHRVFACLGLISAVIAPLNAAALCDFLSRVFRDAIRTTHANQPLPDFTQLWIMRKLPFMPVEVAISLVTLGLGILVFRRKDGEQAMAWLVVICCIAFTMVIILTGSVILAASLPFMEHVAEAK